MRIILFQALTYKLTTVWKPSTITKLLLSAYESHDSIETSFLSIREGINAFNITRRLVVITVLAQKWEELVISAGSNISRTVMQTQRRRTLGWQQGVAPT